MYSNVSRRLLLCYLLAPLLVFAYQPAGQQLFSSSCAGCHGLDGRGGEHAPNIATNENVQRLSDANLARIVRNGIPAAGMPAFGSSFDTNQLKAVVGYLRVLQGKVQTAKITGDAKNGRALFFGDAGCSGCHMVNGQGGFLGADLSGYGVSHSPDQIRDSILNPGKNREPRSATIVVVTRSGKKYSGIVRNEDNFSVQMQTRDGAFHFFDKSDLARIEHPARSLMPSQYGSRLTKTELDDLISYLVTSPGTHPSGGHADNEDDDQ
jgi:putative heme-binding domain-containing protein